jgi:HK97 family phage prohead protease
MSEIEFRSAEVVDVSYPNRIVQAVVMPYEKPAEVFHRGKLITEICSRGAYDGVERRANRVKVNLEHDSSRPIGRATAFHPSRDEGLVADLYISKTSSGDDALELAADGVLDLSAGFALMSEDDGHGRRRVKPGAETWETSTRRRLNACWLHHVSMTSTPAYQDAVVLSVRDDRPDSDGPSATPNRDRLELERMRRLAAEIDIRYGLV